MIQGGLFLRSSVVNKKRKGLNSVSEIKQMTISVRNG